MRTIAVVVEKPEKLALKALDLGRIGDDEIMVDVEWSGISTGTERLLWTGRMPPFPGMGYPLVPGYETVGQVTAAGPKAEVAVGTRVFVPGANCFGDIKGLFGGAASRLIVPARRAVPVHNGLGQEAILIALAATAYHAIAQEGGKPPQLVVGHGILGRLIARIAIARGEAAPVVWEVNPTRRDGAKGYNVIDPNDDPRRDYSSIYDASGAAGILDQMIMRLAKGGEIILAGFYEMPLSFAFPPAFMREARIRIAAEWTKPDIDAVSQLIATGQLDLKGLITHHELARHASEAYSTAFSDPACLKMVVDWRGHV